MLNAAFPENILFESFTFPFFDFNNKACHKSISEAFFSKPDPQPNNGKRGLYIHIPFCETICTFCPFLKTVGTEKRIKQYLEALHKEIDLQSKSPLTLSWEIDAIYIGGGTPSVITPAQAFELITSLKNKFNLTNNVEITFEVEAKSATQELMSALKSSGVTRISFGVQTLDVNIRKHVNLTATIEDIKNTIEMGLKYFDDVNIDMIVGFPGQTISSALSDIRNSIQLQASTISLYPMDYVTVLPKFLDKIRKGQIPEPASVKDRWIMFHKAREILSSNYKTQNMYCFGIGNTSPCKYMFEILYGGYHDQYIGLGSGAYSSIRGLIQHNTLSERKYIDSLLEKNIIPVENASPGHAYEKSFVYFPKRLKVTLSEATSLDIDSSILPKLEYLENLGYIEKSLDEVKLTDLGIRHYERIMVFFLSDAQRRIYDKMCRRLEGVLGLNSDGSMLENCSINGRLGVKNTLS